MHVIDLFGANAYWAEIMAPVVGPKGHVLVWEPTQFYKPDTPKGVRCVHGEEPERVDRRDAVRGSVAAEESADFVMLNLNYHDTYWQSDKYGIPRMDPAASSRLSMRR